MKRLYPVRPNPPVTLLKRTLSVVFGLALLLAVSLLPSSVFAVRTTTTTVTCSLTIVTFNTATICNATVVDTGGTGASSPLGRVSFASNSTGSFANPSCELAPLSGTVGTSVCRVSDGYTPTVVGHQGITGIYTPNATDAAAGNHMGSTSQPFTITVVGQGTVCIIDPAVPSGLGVTSACPAGSSAFTGPPQADITSATGGAGGKAQLRVNINVDDTSAMNGFDIIIIADHTILQPFDVDVSGSVIAGVTIGHGCIGGTPLATPTPSCAVQAQNPDAIEIGVSGAPTPNPAFGNLFTAIYNIIGDVPTGTTVPITFQTGCSISSSLPPFCITLTSGGSASVPILSTVSATYGTAASLAQPFWTFTPGIFTAQAVIGGSTTTPAFTINSANAFTCGGSACLTAITKIITPTYNPASPPFAVSITPIPPWCETSGCISGPQTFTLSVSTSASTPLGSYTVFVEATLSAPPSPPANQYLVTAIMLTVKVVDFSVSASPASLTVIQGAVGGPFRQATSVITITSIGGAAGTVNLACSAGCTGPTGPGPTGAFNSTAIVLPAGGTKHASFTITAGTGVGAFTLTVRGLMTAVPRTTTIAATVLLSTDFFLTSSPTSVSVLAGSPGTSSIHVNGGSTSSGSVSLTVTSIAPATGLLCNTLNPASQSLPAGGASSLSCTAAAFGTFTVTVSGTGSSPSATHSTTVTFVVQDFLLKADVASVSAIVGQDSTAGITAQSENGFTGLIKLSTTSVPATGISCFFNPLNITNPPLIGSSLLHCIGSVPGPYVVTVIAVNNTLTHTVDVNFAIQGFSLSALPTSVTTTPGVAGTSTITATSVLGFGSPNVATVTLSFSSPALLSCSLSKINLHISSNSSTSVLSCSSTTSFTNAKVNVTGASGSITSTITVLYTIGSVSHATTTSVSCMSPVLVGQASTCTATVVDSQAGPTTPSGTVAFTPSGTAGGGFIGSPCALAQVGTTVGTASCTATFTATSSGSASISATYTPTDTHTGSSTTTPFVITVNLRPTTTSVSCAPSPATVGTSTVCTATVTDTAASGATNPSGTVTFSNGGASGSFTPATGMCTLASSGTTQATCHVSYSPTAVGTGSQSITATYGGDTTHQASPPSPAFALTVTKTSPTVMTTLSASSITVGGSVTDSAVLQGATGNAGGTVTYEFFSGSTCAGAGTTVGSAAAVTNGVVPDSASQAFNTVGAFSWNAIYSGDANNGGVTSGCETLNVAAKPTPTLTTVIKDSSGAAVTSITVGTAVHDTAIIAPPAGVTTAITGTVTYALFGNGACTGTGTTVSTVNVGTGNAVPDSAPTTPTPAGSFSFQASYSGDTNYATVTSSCEPLTVSPAPLHTTATVVVCVPGSVNVITPTVCTATVTDTAASGAANPSGSVTFSNGGASGSFTPASAMCTLATSGTTQATCHVSYQPSAVGTGSQSITATYGGDATHQSSPVSVAFALTVTKTSPTVMTTLSLSSITAGGSVTDSAVLQSASSTAGGTVTYEFFSGSTCAGTATTVGSPVTVTNGVVPTSASQAFNSAGAFSWNAIYSGDTNNSGVTSGCETLTVTAKTTPTLTTVIKDASGAAVTSVTLGTAVHDTATIAPPAGVTTAITGTISYTIFGNGACTGTGTIVSTVNIGTGNAVPDSTPTAPAPAGSFGFQASYSGDTNYAPAMSACEPLTVTPVQLHPTTTSLLCSPGSVTVGTSTVCTATVTDTATSGATNPTGTVTFSNGGASGSFTPATAMCTLASSGTTQATCHVSYIPSAVGSGSQSISANYGGDASHSPSSSATAFSLGVTKASPTITTTPFMSSVTVGNTVSDSVIFGAGTAFQPTGTVTYLLFPAVATGSCSGTSKIVSIVTISGGLVPDSRAVLFNSTGTFGFQAGYSGDGNNNIATSSCEPVSVVPVQLHGTTTVVVCAPGSVNVGLQTSCTATTTDGSTTPTTPTGSVNFSSDSGGTFGGSGTCSLTAGTPTGVASCAIAYTPTAVGTGTHTITGSYGGDSTHSTSSGMFQLTVTQPTGQTVQLTFSAFDLDDFENGVGQFQVLVNGHLVVDIPAGLNHLSGSGDYAPYTNTWVKFGPFDITSFVVQGQNTIVFRNPLVSHDGLVRNVTITQGSTILLQVLRASRVEPGEPTTYTFSIPPLKITSFTGQSSPSSGQTVTFTAAYTGGTAPFKCVFRFGDDQSAVVSGSTSTCSATHSYDDQGTFRASVRVIGNSTSDVQTARLFVTVPQTGSSVVTATPPLTGFPASDDDEEDLSGLQVDVDD